MANPPVGLCESVQTIINIASTAEALAVAALGGVLQSQAGGHLGLTPDEVNFVKYARYEEYLHYQYLLSAGAKPLTTTFTLPDTNILTDKTTFFRTLVNLEEAFIAAYIAAGQEFASQGKRDLVKISIQIGGVEGEHRAMARCYALTDPDVTTFNGVPNNFAFEKGMFSSVGQAAKALEQEGWIGGSGPQFSYPNGGVSPEPVGPTTPNKVS